jgi:outer membrane protein assembly factor BamB
VAAPLVSATLRAAGAFAAGQPAAGGGVAVHAVTLAESVLKTMLLAKLPLTPVLLLGLALLSAAVAVITCQGLAGNPPARQAAANQRAADKPPDRQAAEGNNLNPDIRQTRGLWPQWRGPNRDGTVHGVPVPARWPQTLIEEWAVSVGQGVASPVAADGKVYVFTRHKDDESLVCLDLHSGKELWRSQWYPAPYKVGPGEGDANDRPRSTPAVAAGRVFTLGMTGILTCLDAATGKLQWRKDTLYAPYMGSSPLVADDLCIAHVGDGTRGGLTAFDVATGDVKWCFSEGYSAMSGSPIFVNLAGERQLVTYSAWNAAGVSLATGRKLWGVGPGGGGVPCTTPVLYKDWIILAHNMDSLRALRLARGDKGLTATEVWKAQQNLKLYYTSPVVAGDLVFGMSTHNQGCYFCLEARTGKTLWVSEGRQGNYTSFLNLGSVLLFLKERGQLLVVKPSAKAFEPIAEYRIGDRPTMAHPVFLGDRILIKDDLTLRSFRLGPDRGQPW